MIITSLSVKPVIVGFDNDIEEAEQPDGKVLDEDMKPSELTCNNELSFCSGKYTSD